MIITVYRVLIGKYYLPLSGLFTHENVKQVKRQGP